MVLYKRLALLRLALLVLILSLASNPAMSASEELQVLKGKMTVLQDQIAQEEIQGKNLAIKESQLTKKIKLLKKDARSKPSLLSNLRIESLLKELRENLIIQQENENRRSLLEEQIIQTKADLDSKMEVEVSRLIESAREAFKTGDEARSDRFYQEALHLMEERKQFQTEAIVLSPAPPPFGEFILDGKESLDKLREIADFAIHDLENIRKEIRLL
ncbi:MAG: hypothetical protein HY200_03300 [Nitrospirae bacterium]|nr:hypothetical protein [Nitrospirota bacterium]